MLTEEARSLAVFKGFCAMSAAIRNGLEILCLQKARLDAVARLLHHNRSASATRRDARR